MFQQHPWGVLHPSPYPALSQRCLGSTEPWAVFLTISHIPDFRRFQSSLESHFSTLMRCRAQESGLSPPALLGTTSSLTHCLITVYLSPPLHFSTSWNRSPLSLSWLPNSRQIKREAQIPGSFQCFVAPLAGGGGGCVLQFSACAAMLLFPIFLLEFLLLLIWFASFCRAHRFLLRPLNYIFNMKYRNRQNTS